MTEQDFCELYHRMIEVHRLSPAAAKELLNRILEILNTDQEKKE